MIITDIYLILIIYPMVVLDLPDDKNRIEMMLVMV